MEKEGKGSFWPKITCENQVTAVNLTLTLPCSQERSVAKLSRPVTGEVVTHGLTPVARLQVFERVPTDDGES